MMKSFLLSLLVAFVANAETPAPTFTGESAKIKTHLDGLFDASKNVNKPGAEGKNAQGKLEQAIDWNEIATECLGKTNAKKHAGKGFNEFRDILKSVVLKTAYSRMDKFWETGTSYVFSKIDIKGNKATAAAKFTVKEEAFSLDYFLAKVGTEWKVTDIAYEDLRYATNINEQIEAFLKEKPFSELITKLKKRRQDLDNPSTKADSKSGL